MPSLVKTVPPLLALLLAAPAMAQLTVSTGFDSGASSLGANSASAAAQASFLSRTGGRVVADFEGTTPEGLSIRGAQVTDNGGCRAALCGFNTTVDGSLFLLSPGTKTTVTLTFADGVNYFGAYFSGLQLANSTITFQDGTRQQIALPYIDANLGGMAFVGFTNGDKLINSVSIYTGNDIVAIDDLVYGRASVTPVPEAGTFATMSLGLLALAGLRRAARQPAS